LGPDYRKLWTAAGISTLGDGVREAALPLLAASLTRDPAAVAAVALAGRLPWLLFSLVSGALVDRWDRRRVMWQVDTGRALVVTALAAAVLLESTSILLLVVVAFVLGTGETLFDNAAQALMPSVVSRQRLEEANSRLYVVQISSQEFVGPPLGSLLFGLVAVSAPFFVDAGSFFVAAALVLTITGVYRAPRRQPQEHPRLRTEIGEGLRWLWRHRLLRTLIVGSLLATRITRRIGPGRALLVAVVVSAAADIVVALTSNAYLVGVMGALGSSVGIVWNVITVSLRQAIIPDELLGRVNSVYRFVGWGMMPIGAALGGAIATAFGLRATYWLGGASLFAMALLTFRIVNNRAAADARAAAGA
jgi:MFS family permease